MESMDDVHREVLKFSEALEIFNERLDSQLKDLSACHDRVSPLWQDEMRRTYDATYSHLREAITRYSEIEGPEYTDFLTEKVMHVKRYLFDG